MAIKKLSQITFIKQQLDNSNIYTSGTTVEVTDVSEIPQDLPAGTVVKVQNASGELTQYTTTSQGQTDVTKMVSVESVDVNVRSIYLDNSVVLTKSNTVVIGSSTSQLDNIYTKNVTIDGVLLQTYVQNLHNSAGLQWNNMI